LPQMRPNNPVRVLIPGREPPPAAAPAAAPGKPSEGGGEEQEEPPPPASSPAPNPANAKPATPDKKPGEIKPPITITAYGNRLVGTSDDPQALATVQELVKLLTTTPPGEGDFAVIHLKNASAEDVAKVLDEAFNGTKPQSNNQNQGFPFGGGFGRF